MRKDLGPQAGVFPMPVLMVAAYNEDGKVDIMNAAWGQICKSFNIILFINKEHATTKSILKTKAFTVSLPSVDTLAEADYVGMVSGNDVPDKFEKTGLTAVKSEKVNAPVIEEFPITMECEFIEEIDSDNMHAIVGKIVNVSADEKVLDAEGKVEVEKVNTFAFDNYKLGYYAIGEKIAMGWDAGKKFVD